MLGLTFRNSKWSNYARPNLSTKLTESYTRFMRIVLILGVLLVTSTSFLSFYTTTETLNLLSAVFWFVNDLLSFSFCFVYLTIIFWVQTGLAKLYSLFWLSWGNTSSKSTLTDSNIQSKNQYVPKHLRKYTLYSYLKSPVQNNLDLSTFFPMVDSTAKSNNSYETTRLIYQTTTTLNWLSSLSSTLVQRGNTSANLSNTSVPMSRTSLWGNNSQVLTSYTPLVLNYNITSRQVSKPLDNSLNTPLKNLHRWNLYGFIAESELQGNFYVPEINLSTLNKFTVDSNYSLIWSDAIAQTLKSVKSQYWLYKYNLLHRSVFKNTHTLTVVKRLIGTGFFDSKLMKTNLWASTELDAFTNYKTFQANNMTTFDLLYNVSNNQTSASPLQTLSSIPANNLQILSFYQSSFNWFLTRSYNFSGLQSSPLTSSYQVLNSSIIKPTGLSASARLKVALAPYLQSALLTNNLFLGQLALSSGKFAVEGSYGTANVGLTYNAKDIYMFYSAQSSYNLTTLNLLLNLLQVNTTQAKLFQYPQLVTPLKQSKALSTMIDHNLTTELTPSYAVDVYPSLSSLENIFLGDLVAYTVLLNK